MTRLTLAVLALLAAGSAQATCIYPRAPDKVPDGKSASEAEMVAAHKAVQVFNEDITAYTACLELEMTALVQSGSYDENRLNELRAMQAKKNNAAVDEAQAVADQFNEQLRVYNARGKSD
jgi:uncharacterized protein YfkK (UPF0435 family)